MIELTRLEIEHVRYTLYETKLFLEEHDMLTPEIEDQLITSDEILGQALAKFEDRQYELQEQELLQTLEDNG